MSDTCDPRKTGCDCYPFPHRRNSHPERECTWLAVVALGSFQSIDIELDFSHSKMAWHEYSAPLTGLDVTKEIEVSIENGQLVVMQDE